MALEWKADKNVKNRDRVAGLVEQRLLTNLGVKGML